MSVCVILLSSHMLVLPAVSLHSIAAKSGQIAGQDTVATACPLQSTTTE